MKILRWIAWISLVVAGVIIILAIVSLGVCKGLFGFSHTVNYFIAADSFALVAIALFIVTRQCCCCECKDDKKGS
jgi:hypothetical protein